MATTDTPHRSSQPSNSHQGAAHSSRPARQQRERLLAAALDEADRGHYVFPLRPGGKNPALHGQAHCPGVGDCAHGHLGWEDRATRDPHQIHNWWNHAPYNIAIATGPSGLLVLDLDHSHNHPAPDPWRGALHGRDVLARLAHTAQQPYPHHTRTVATPSGGIHLYFHTPEHTPLRSTVGRLGWHIDSRGHGGYIIAAGSSTAHGTYRLVRHAPITPLPPWLLPLLQPPPPPLRTPLPRGPYRDRTDRARSYLDAVLTRLSRADIGTRRHTLLCCAVSLGRLTAGGEYNETHIRAELERAAATFTAFPITETRRTINDGIRWGLLRPRRLDT